MKIISILLTLVAGAVAAATPIPTLERRGQATQLIVDGKPWLTLGGEIANTASSDSAYMQTVWPTMTKLNLNTVLVPIAWAWVEPVEGRFDFKLVDELLAGARDNQQRVIFLWFGSWKNGLSSFVPSWVKQDQRRFPRVRLSSGHAVEILSPFHKASLEADQRAYVQFVKHLASVDASRTTIMIQMQNEVGVLGDSRDHGEAANAAYAAQVPRELMSHLQKREASLSPALLQQWQKAGKRSTGSWAEVFGANPVTDELFMAWHFARFMGAMTEAGKDIYPLPVFTNTWIVQPEDKRPGDYPSGGPQPLSLDVWKAGAPSIDFSAPDIYLPNFDEHVAAFHRPDNALFVPESRGDAAGVANAFYCIGAHASLGYSPFGIDNTSRLLMLRPPPGTAAPTDLSALPLTRGYALLRDLTPLILEHQAKGTIAGAWLSKAKPTGIVELAGYRLNFELRKNRRTGEALAESAYAIVMASAPGEFLIAANDVQVIFSPATPGPMIAGIADAESGTVKGGRWQAKRKMSGDDILLNYDVAGAAKASQSGSGLFFGPDGPAVQRVKLYRYGSESK